MMNNINAAPAEIVDPRHTCSADAQPIVRLLRPKGPYEADRHH